jgi:F0F1-type ATP synthase alpha subunit
MIKLYSSVVAQRRHQVIHGKGLSNSLSRILPSNTSCYRRYLSIYTTRQNFEFNNTNQINNVDTKLIKITMKFQSLLVAASATTTVSAWTNTPVLRSAIVHHLPRTSPYVCRKLSTSIFNGNHQHRTIVSRRMSTAGAIEEEAITKQPVQQSIETDVINFDRLGHTIAEGTIFTQYPGGLVAIKINEEFVTDSTSKKSKTIQLQTDGLATPKQLSTVRVEVGDYQGKQVVFPDGSIGVVVAHRPPMVFVYIEQSTTNQNNNNNNNNNLSTLQQNNNIVSVKSEGARVSVSSLNNVVDCFGRPVVESVDKILNGNVVKMNTDETIYDRCIFSPIPQVKDIALINNPMLTGITMIDSLASIGRGQNMLLVGHDFENMRSIVVDFLKTQVGQENTKCIYASTEEDSKDVLKRFSQAGLDSNDIHLVTSSKFSMTGDDIKPNDPAKAAEAVVIASTACAIGESYALTNGAHSLVIVDAMDYHKKLWDCTTRVLVDVFGVDAVVKSDREGGSSSEMRVFFSSLVQRAAQYKDNLGGGSVTLLLLVSIPKESTSSDDDGVVFTADDFATAPIKIQERIKVLVEKNIPLSEATLRKIKVPIPTDSEGGRRFVLQHVDDLISMSDGQIWLDERLEMSGRRPPVDPQRSITRIGIGADTESRADAPAIRRIAEGLRLELAQASDNLLMTSGNAATAALYQNRKQQSLLLAMHQESAADTKPRKLSESCVALLAAQKGLLNQFVENGNVQPGSEEGTRLINDLLHCVNKDIPKVLSNIDKTLDITKEEQDSIIQSIQSFISR